MTQFAYPISALHLFTLARHQYAAVADTTGALFIMDIATGNLLLHEQIVQGPIASITSFNPVKRTTELIFGHTTGYVSIYSFLKNHQLNYKTSIKACKEPIKAVYVIAKPKVTFTALSDQQEVIFLKYVKKRSDLDISTFSPHNSHPILSVTYPLILTATGVQSVHSRKKKECLWNTTAPLVSLCLDKRNLQRGLAISAEGVLYNLRLHSCKATALPVDAGSTWRSIGASNPGYYFLTDSAALHVLNMTSRPPKIGMKVEYGALLHPTIELGNGDVLQEEMPLMDATSEFIVVVLRQTHVAVWESRFMKYSKKESRGNPTFQGLGLVQILQPVLLIGVAVVAVRKIKAKRAEDLGTRHLDELERLLSNSTRGYGGGLHKRAGPIQREKRNVFGGRHRLQAAKSSLTPALRGEARHFDGPAPSLDKFISE